MLLSFLPQLFTALLALISIRIYTELLNPLQLGETMLLLGVVAFVDAVIFSAINQTVFYFTSKEEDKFKIFTIINKYSSFLKFIYLFLALNLLLFLFDKNYIIYVHTTISTILYILISPLSGAYQSILNYSQDRKRYAFLLIFESILTLIIVSIILIYLKHWSFVLLGMVISKIIVTHLNILFLYKYINNVVNSATIQFNFLEEVIKYFKYYRSISFMGILGWIASFADRFIIAFSLGVITSGYYSVASGLISRPYNVLSATFTVHFRPAFYDSISNHDYDSFKKIQFQWILGVILFSLFGVLLLYFFGGIIVDLLLAKSYREEIENILWLIGISLFFSILTHVYDNKFLALGLSNKLLKIQLYLTPIPLVSIFIGGYYFGIQGAILGRILSEFFKMSVTFYYSNKEKI